MKKFRRYRTAALWIILMLLYAVLSFILFAQIDSDMPMEMEVQQTENGGVE